VHDETFSNPVTSPLARICRIGPSGRQNNAGWLIGRRFYFVNSSNNHETDPFRNNIIKDLVITVGKI
jgi:hypothetical protein